MGYNIKFNWILQLSEKQGFPKKLVKNKTYPFRKGLKRIYPIDIPIDLMNKERKICGKVIIKEITIRKDKTKGKFKVFGLQT